MFVLYNGFMLMRVTAKFRKILHKSNVRVIPIMPMLSFPTPCIALDWEYVRMMVRDAEWKGLTFQPEGDVLSAYRRNTSSRLGRLD